MASTITKKPLNPVYFHLYLTTIDNVFYIGVVCENDYPYIRRFVKFDLRNNKKEIKEVDEMYNISFSCSVGYHYDFLSTYALKSIEEYIDLKYPINNVVPLWNSKIYKPSQFEDDIPF